MQMIQDGAYTNASDKPLRMTGTVESCRVRFVLFNLDLNESNIFFV